MDIQVTARHFHASTELQESVKEKIQKLEKFYHNITSALVVLDAEKERVRRVEVKMNILDKDISASAEEENMGKAIESVLQKLQRQLKKENAKLKEHRGESLAQAISG